MEIAHSRLLKFLLPYSENMSKHTLIYEYIKPSNIESEVPGKQDIREPQNGNNTENNDSNTEQEKDNFVPVLAITKEETALTKGDVKLQKVLVTENVAESTKQNSRHPIDTRPYLQEEVNSDTAKVINPMYSEIQSEVISGAQPFRKSNKDTKVDEDNKDKMEVSHKDREEKKIKTRIPTLKFKQTVEIIKKERKNSSQEQEKIKHPSQGRRSSIPKLRRRRSSTSISDDKIKVNNSAANKKDTDVDKPDEEFEKLYDEVVDDKKVEDIAEKILPDNIENPDELDTSFEEIIHAYDENKIQCVAIEKNKSKIPFNKQRSLHKESIPKQVERRLSLKTKSLDEKEKQYWSQFTQLKTDKKITMVKKDDLKTTDIEADCNKAKLNDIAKEVKKENISNSLNIEANNTTKNVNKSIFPTENKETRDTKSIDEVKEVVKETQTNTPSENIKLVQPDDTNNSTMPDSSKMVINMFPLHNNQKNIDSNEHAQPLDKVNQTILKDEERDFDVNKSNSTTTTKNTLNKLKQKRSILSKIAIFQGKEAPANKRNDEDTTQNSKERKRMINEKENNINTENNYVKPIDIESKEPNELNNNENIGILHKYEILDDTVQDKPNNTNLTADFIETNSIKGEVVSNLIENGDNEASDRIEDKKSDEKNVEYEEVSEVKGKISDIVSRIDSNDKNKLTLKKEIKIDIPKNRSVFSKIAMFERQSYEKPLKIKEELPDNKEKVFRIKEIDINNVEQRTPKIIDTVLKSQPLRKSLIDDNVSNSQIPSSDSDIAVPYKTTEAMSTNKVHEIQHTKTNKTLQAAETEQPYNNQLSKDKETAESDPVSKNPTTALENGSNRVTENLDSKSLNSNTIRSKPLNETELGDSIKGKVRHLVVRINSFEKIEVGKKEVINVRERPKKRSVSEKIALFERKLSPVQLESTDTTTTTTTAATTNTPKPDSETNNYLPKPLTEEEYQKRIEELETASAIYGKVKKMPSVKLRDGRKMPVLSVGTALLDTRLIQPIIKAAIDLGYRAIDTAFIYGNEKEIGEAIKSKIDDGTVTREELFIVNKLWNTFHSQDLVEKACRDSLAAMGLEYFDLYLVHSPISFKEGKEVVPMIANVLQYSDHDYMDAWFGMEDLVKKGLAKSIGVSNFNSQQVARVEEKARVKPVVNQVECHPYLSQQRLADACAVSGIKLSCFGVLGSKGTPDDLKTNLLPVIDDALVTVMAAGLNVTAAQLLIRYQIDSGHLAVVKASSAAHLWSNLKALDFQLTEAQLNALNSLNKNKRTYTFKGMGETHRNYPFSAPF